MFLFAYDVPLLLAVLPNFVLLICWTRFHSGLGDDNNNRDSKGRRRPSIRPYWLPYLGHITALFSRSLVSWQDFLRRPKRGRGISNITSLYIIGSTFNITEDPAVVSAIVEHNPHCLSSNGIIKQILICILEANHQHARASDPDLEQFFGSSTFNNSRVKDLDALTATFVAAVQEHVPDFVSMNESLVDQHPWERVAGVEVTRESFRGSEPNSKAKVRLCKLVRAVVGHFTILAVFGPTFAETSPLISEELWDLDRGWPYLYLRLPRWLPIPSLLKSHIARRKLLSWLRAIHQRIGVSANNYELSNFYKDRLAAYDAHSTPIDLRASLDLSLLWRMIIPSSDIVYRMLLEIYRRPSHLWRIREEMEAESDEASSPAIRAYQPTTKFRVPERRRLQIDIDLLVSSCPELKGMFLDIWAEHPASLTLREITQTFTVMEPSPAGEEEDDDADRIKSARSHETVLETSSYLVIPHDALAEADLRPHPPASRKDSHVRQEVWVGDLSPYPDKSHKFLERQVLAIVAAIVALWDIEPDGRLASRNPEKSDSFVVSERRGL